jgi:YbbR domain-containing protein
VASRSLPVSPQLTGTPAAGYSVRSATVDPSVVTVLGPADQIAALQVLPTIPVSLAGRSADFSTTVTYALPGGVTMAGSSSAVVTVHIAADRGSRAFGIGLGLVGATADRTYVLSVPAVLVTLGGAGAALAAVDAATLQATVDVGSLPLGTSSVTVQFTPPTGLTTVSISPGSVNVTVTAVATPPPVPTPTP